MNKIQKTVLSIGIAVPISILFNTIVWLLFHLIMRAEQSNEKWEWLLLILVPILYLVYGIIHSKIRKKLNFSYTATFSITNCVLALIHGTLIGKTYYFDKWLFRPVVVKLFSGIKSGLGYFMAYMFYFVVAVIIWTVVFFVTDLIITDLKARKAVREISKQPLENPVE